MSSPSILIPATEKYRPAYNVAVKTGKVKAKLAALVKKVEEIQKNVEGIFQDLYFRTSNSQFANWTEWLKKLSLAISEESWTLYTLPKKVAKISETEIAGAVRLIRALDVDLFLLDQECQEMLSDLEKGELKEANSWFDLMVNRSREIQAKPPDARLPMLLRTCRGELDKQFKRIENGSISPSESPDSESTQLLRDGCRLLMQTTQGVTNGENLGLVKEIFREFLALTYPQKSVETIALLRKSLSLIAVQESESESSGTECSDFENRDDPPEMLPQSTPEEILTIPISLPDEEIEDVSEKGNFIVVEGESFPWLCEEQIMTGRYAFDPGQKIKAVYYASNTRFTPASVYGCYRKSWKKGEEIKEIAQNILRLRHQVLISLKDIGKNECHQAFDTFVDQLESWRKSLEELERDSLVIKLLKYASGISATLRRLKRSLRLLEAQDIQMAVAERELLQHLALNTPESFFKAASTHYPLWNREVLFNFQFPFPLKAPVFAAHSALMTSLMIHEILAERGHVVLALTPAEKSVFDTVVMRRQEPPLEVTKSYILKRATRYLYLSTGQYDNELEIFLTALLSNPSWKEIKESPVLAAYEKVVLPLRDASNLKFLSEALFHFSQVQETERNPEAMRKFCQFLVTS